MSTNTHLLYVSVESALLAEDVGAVRAHDPVHVVHLPHVLSEVRDLLVTLRTWEILEAGHMDLQSVDVEGSLGGELLSTVRTLLHTLT